MVKLEINNRPGVTGNINKTSENPNFFKLSLKRSSSKNSLSSVSSLNESRKLKSASTSESEISELDAKNILNSDEESECASPEKNKELNSSVNLPEDAFLRRHELYVTDIEDSSDVLFAIAPIIR